MRTVLRMDSIILLSPVACNRTFVKSSGLLCAGYVHQPPMLWRTTEDRLHTGLWMRRWSRRDLDADIVEIRSCSIVRVGRSPPTARWLCFLDEHYVPPSQNGYGCFFLDGATSEGGLAGSDAAASVGFDMVVAAWNG